MRQVNQPPATDDRDQAEPNAGDESLVKGAAERSGVEVGSMILAVNGVSVRGKGVVGVGNEVKKATGAVELELAALRSAPPSARKAWPPASVDIGSGGDVDASESNSAEHDSSGEQARRTVALADTGASPAAAAGSDDVAPAGETIHLNAAPATSSASRSRKRKPTAQKAKRHNSTKKSQKAADDSIAAKTRCELCRCSTKQAMAAMHKRGSKQVISAFPTGFREGYCCDCYDKLVEDIKKKKALQAERQREQVATAKKAADEKEEEEAQQKASSLPTLDEHFRAHGVEAYTFGSSDAVAAVSGDDGGNVSSGGRGVRALRKFPAAVTVWTEPPYVALLRYERWNTRCQSCFMTATEANATAAGKGSKQRKMSACSRCGCVKYCCRDCQKADWPDHKHECAVLKRRASSTSQADRREDTIDVDILMARIWRRRTKRSADGTSNPRKQYARSFAYADVEEEEHLQSHEQSFEKQLLAVRY